MRFVECPIPIFIGRRKRRLILGPSKSSDVLEIWERWKDFLSYRESRVTALPVLSLPID